MQFRDEAICGYYAVKKNIKRILIFPFLAGPYICGFLEISVTATREEREGWCCCACYNNVNCRWDERIPFKFVCSFCSGQAEDSNYTLEPVQDSKFDAINSSTRVWWVNKIVIVY